MYKALPVYFYSKSPYNAGMKRFGGMENRPNNADLSKNRQGEASANLGQYTRRDFLALAGISGGAGLAALALEASLKKLLVKTENREYKGIKIPDFVVEESFNHKEKFIPENVIQLIDKACKELESQKTGFRIVPTPVKPGAKETAFKDKLESDVLLAAVDLINQKSEIEILRLDYATQQLEEDEDGHQVQIGEKLGVGTGYEVVVPEQHVVLATKQAIMMGDKPTEVVYSPYTPDLDIPNVRLEGFEYLVDLLQSAKQELNKKGIKSRFDKTKEVASGVPLEVALMLTIVEQVDPIVFNKQAQRIAKKYKISQAEADMQAVKSMAKKGLTVVGQNRKNARRYARSPKGASGLFQLMPGTYRSLAGVDFNKNGNLEKIDKPIYPKANLNPDFIEGATDHANAAQAAWLLLDSDLYSAGETLRKKLLEDSGQLGKFLAACYNAGSRPIRELMEKYGNDWASHVSSEETRIYIRKIAATQALFNNQVKPLPELPATASDKMQEDRNRSAKRSLEDIPLELRGSAASLAKQNEMAKKDGLVFVKTLAELDKLTQHNIPLAKRKNPKFIPLPEEKGLIEINQTKSGIESAERRYCLPQTRKFLIDMAKASKAFNPDFEPLMINSAVRPKDLQESMTDSKNRKYNPNASAHSSHPTGATFDIAYNANSAGYKGMSQTQLEWTERYLMQYEKLGLVEAVEERSQPVFHVMVFEDYVKTKK